MRRQTDIRNIGAQCFGHASMSDPRERLFRFAEEAFELMRAAGMSRAEIVTVMEYELEREPGQLPQELAGVGCTLYALADVHGRDLDLLIEQETRRVYEQRERIRAKQAQKPANVVSTRVGGVS